MATKDTTKDTKTTKESVSAADAAEAFVLLHDSGNYSSRDYDLLLGQLRDSVQGNESEDETGELAELTATVLAQHEEGTLLYGDQGPVLAANVKEAVAKRDADAEAADKSGS